jgi:hypothetical protein
MESKTSYGQSLLKKYMLEMVRGADVTGKTGNA